MAHLIDFSNNRANIAYTGELPWHGLGQAITEGSPIDVWAKAGGLEWQAKKASALFKVKDSIQSTEAQVIYRDDTLAHLGIVTDRYKIVQPREILEFYRDLIDLHNFQIHTVGSLDGGKRVWALAKTSASFKVLGTIDKVDTFLLLSTSFDGKSATVGQFTSVRVVCANTLSLANKDNNARFSTGHHTAFNADKLKTQLGVYNELNASLEHDANILASKRLSRSQAVELLCKIYANQDTPEGLSTRQGNIIKNVFNLYNGSGYGSSLASADGTAWGLLNAVTQYTDHEQGHSINNKIRSSWFGQGDTFKTNAKNLLLEVAA